MNVVRLSLTRASHPSAIAVVGASGSGSRATQHGGRGGAGFIRNIQKAGFPGRIYPINPNVSDVLGLKAYPNLASLPEPVDLVIVAVPAPDVPAVLEDCIASGNRTVHVFSAGFRETGEPEGIQLEEEVRRIALRGKLNLIGPNSMGFCYVPGSRISIWDGMPMQSGPVAFLSQSGGHCLQFIHYAQPFGIGFSKVISFGNACILDSTDYLDFLAADDDTKIICLYLEGVKNGRKLLEMVREINRSKPVILWKGGLTESGARAAASHTGSMAGSEAIWKAFYKQTGAVYADSLDELADVLVTFLRLPPPRGRRLGVLLGGGGYSVAAADTCNREGLQVPQLASQTVERLRRFIGAAGTSIRNPLDIELVMRDVTPFQEALELVAADPSVDALLISQHLDLLRETGPDQVRRMGDYLIRFARENKYGKPILAVLDSWGGDAEMRAERARLGRELPEAGIPIYRNLARAARGLSRFMDYQDYLKRG